MGVEQAEETKTKSFWLLGLHCGEATHWETDLETRREPDDGGGGFISYEIARLSFFAQNKKLSSVMSTSGHQPGLDAAHADGDFSALILSRKDFDHSLQHLDVGIVYVPTAVIIHSGHGEAVLEGT